MERLAWTLSEVRRLCKLWSRGIIYALCFERLPLATMLKTDFVLLGGNREAMGHRQGLRLHSRWDNGGFHNFGNSGVGKEGLYFWTYLKVEP